jgi:GH15 family glucan-1,4-alpha-glucosidase
MIVLRTKAPLRGEDHTTTSEFTVRKGETMAFTLTYSSSLEKVPLKSSAKQALEDTQRFWARWLKKNMYRGEYAAAVSRSLMTLKALTYRPTGGIVAAVTAAGAAARGVSRRGGGVAAVAAARGGGCAGPGADDLWDLRRARFD